MRLGGYIFFVSRGSGCVAHVLLLGAALGTLYCEVAQPRGGRKCYWTAIKNMVL